MAKIKNKKLELKIFNHGISLTYSLSANESDLN